MNERRKAEYELLRKELKELGYYAPAIHLSRWMLYRVIVVAINHLAHALERHPFRVWQALLCRAERTRLQRPYTPWRQAQPTPGGQAEGERGLRVMCPYCHKDLLKAGEFTEAEVKARMRQEKAQNLPQSGESEASASR